jgi:hypothetical protein
MLTAGSNSRWFGLLCVALSALMVALLLPFSAEAAVINLGQAGNYAVLSLGKTAPSGTSSFNEQNDTTIINGNLGLGPLATAGASNDKGTVTGSVFVDSTATYTQGGVVVNGSVMTGQNLTQARTDALAASAAAAALPPTVTAGNVTAATTFNSTGQQTVVSATSINLQGPSANLTLNGGPNDEFIINVSGLFHLSGGDIILTGGLTANHVLFNLTDQAGQLADIVNASTTANGTFLAPLRSFDSG